MEQFPQVLDRPRTRPAEPTHSFDWSRTPSPALVSSPSAEESPFPTDLSEVSTRQLRTLCNRTYQLLDSDYPSMETRDRYEALVEELERRESAAEAPAEPEGTREKFRDNALFSRFELYRNGVMAGYVQYEMRGGDVLLLQAVIDSRFRRMGLEPVLMQAVLFNAHRRRLAVMPYCREAQDFLLAHPQFLSLIPTKQRRRFKLLTAARQAAQQEA